MKLKNILAKQAKTTKRKMKERSKCIKSHEFNPQGAECAAYATLGHRGSLKHLNDPKDHSVMKSNRHAAHQQTAKASAKV